MHWIWPSIGGALFGFGLGSISDAALTLVIDSYRDVRLSLLSTTSFPNIVLITLQRIDHRRRIHRRRIPPQCNQHRHSLCNQSLAGSLGGSEHVHCLWVYQFGDHIDDNPDGYLGEEDERVDRGKVSGYGCEAEGMIFGFITVVYFVLHFVSG